MRVVADENIDRQIIESLKEVGFEVTAIADVARGASDHVVPSRSVAEAGVLLTADKDFGDLVFRQRLVTGGVVLVRLSGLSHDARARLVKAAFHAHSSLFAGSFTVIEAGGVRVRPAPGESGETSS